MWKRKRMEMLRWGEGPGWGGCDWGWRGEATLPWAEAWTRAPCLCPSPWLIPPAGASSLAGMSPGEGCSSLPGSRWRSSRAVGLERPRDFGTERMRLKRAKRHKAPSPPSERPWRCLNPASSFSPCCWSSVEAPAVPQGSAPSGLWPTLAGRSGGRAWVQGPCESSGWTLEGSRVNPEPKQDRREPEPDPASWSLCLTAFSNVVAGRSLKEEEWDVSRVSTKKKKTIKRKKAGRRSKIKSSNFYVFLHLLHAEHRSQIRLLTLLAARAQDSFPELLLFCSSLFHSFTESEWQLTLWKCELNASHTSSSAQLLPEAAVFWRPESDETAAFLRVSFHVVST